MMKKSIKLTVGLFISSASFVFAALDPDTVLQSLINEFLTPLYQLTAAIAFVYFLYGAAKFIYDMKNPEEKNTGKQHLLWGMVGLFIIFSVGGILQLFGSMFGGPFTY